jgi:hypothetical protein
MFRPGAYVPDPTEGIVDVNNVDLCVMCSSVSQRCVSHAKRLLKGQEGHSSKAETAP